MSNVRYFSHDRDALIDPKIEEMRLDYGMEGYGIYWAIVEALCHEPDLSMPYSKKKFKMLQMRMNTNVNLMEYVDKCIEWELFKTDGYVFWSESLRGRLASVLEISEKRSKAALVRWAKEKAGNKNQAKEQTEEKKVESVPANDTEDEALRMIQQEQNEVLEAMESAGFKMSSTLINKASDLFAEYGKEMMLNAISECVEGAKGSAVNYKYLKAILEGMKERKDHPNEEEQPKYDEEVKWFR